MNWYVPLNPLSDTIYGGEKVHIIHVFKKERNSQVIYNKPLTSLINLKTKKKPYEGEKVKSLHDFFLNDVKSLLSLKEKNCVFVVGISIRGKSTALNVFMFVVIKLLRVKFDNLFAAFIFLLGHFIYCSSHFILRSDVPFCLWQRFWGL